MASETIPKQCKAGVVVNEGPNFKIEVQLVDVPTPAPDEVLLRLNATGLCMSDVHFMLGDWGLPPMSTFGVQCAGHEGAGVVVAVGDAVKDWKVGDRGGVKPLWDVCGNCELCYTGKENYCQKGVYTGLMKQGTYCQYVVSPARYTSRIPDGVSDAVAGPIMCSASTMYRALNEAAMQPGQWAVFPGGGGGVGIQGVQLAKAMGLRPVVVDAGDDKKKLALKYGAEQFIDFRETKDVAAKVKEVCDGIGAHAVFVTAYQSYAAAITYVGDRIGAKIMCIALPPKDYVTVGAEPSIFSFRNLTIKGSLVGTMGDTAAALEYAKRGMLHQIADVWPMSRFNEGVQLLYQGKVSGRIVIDFNTPVTINGKEY